MRYLELMAERPLVWALFGLYMVATSWLAWLGHKKTGDIKSFAIGKGDMSPIVVGITLAASIASTATFVINPGFVYAHGISALLHIGVSVSLGVIVGLVAMSTGFRRVGAASGALTLPQWIGDRYKSKLLTVMFACISLLYLCFVVLIVGGLSIVMQQTLGLTNVESLILIITFVFGYVFIGGAYAHAYTNTLQGIIMVVIAAIIVGSGLHFFSGGISGPLDQLAAVDPNLAAPINPASSLFNSFFSVYVSGFVIGFAIVCQPHIMTKALFVKDARAVRRYLAVTIVVSMVFSAMLLVGLYAHLSGIPADQLVRQDAVVMTYVTHTFSPTMVAVITVALMAAGMSTLDGILVALSSIAANDLFLNIADKNLLRDATAAEKSRAAHRASQLILILLGVAAFVIAVDPPKLLGIFGQVGVYGIVAASAAPILFGILIPALQRNAALAAAVTGLGIHFGLYFAEYSANPGVTAAWGVIASMAVAGLAGLVALRRSKAAPAATTASSSASSSSSSPSSSSPSPSASGAAARAASA
jgi:SSS family solute:Na+ symporter/sodium/pantothenate symporter